MAELVIIIDGINSAKCYVNDVLETEIKCRYSDEFIKHLEIFYSMRKDLFR